MVKIVFLTLGALLLISKIINNLINIFANNYYKSPNNRIFSENDYYMDFNEFFDQIKYTKLFKTKLLY